MLLGWRQSTLDVDLKLVPDQDSLLRAIPALKESLQLNVELAAPDDFIPVAPSWQEHSPFIAQEGRLTFRHFDLSFQALAKIERGHVQDLNDVRELQRQIGPNDPLSRELEGIANNLQGMIRDANRVGDPDAIAKLANQIIEPFRGVEMELSRALQILLAKDNIRSAQEDEIPADYRKYVEEYYKKLSNSNNSNNGANSSSLK